MLGRLRRRAPAGSPDGGQFTTGPSGSEASPVALYAPPVNPIPDAPALPHVDKQIRQFITDSPPPNPYDPRYRTWKDMLLASLTIGPAHHNPAYQEWAAAVTEHVDLGSDDNSVDHMQDSHARLIDIYLTERVNTTLRERA